MSDTQGADPLAIAERAPKLAQQLQGLRGIVCVTNHGERDDYYPSDKPNPCAIEAAQALTALARAYVEQTEALHKAEIARDHQHSLYISECGETDRIAEILGTDADLELPEAVAALKARAEAAESECLRLREQLARLEDAVAHANEYDHLDWIADSYSGDDPRVSPFYDALERHAARQRAEEDDHA